MRTRTQKIGVTAVKTITAPLHIGVMVATGATCATLDYITNTIEHVGMATANNVARVEGYLTEKIDGTPRADVTDERISYTAHKMLLAAQKVDKLKNYSQGKLKQANAVIKDSASSIKKEFVKPIPVEEQIEALQEQRTEVLANPEGLPDAVVAQKCRLINKEIGNLNKLLKKDLPEISPSEAFTPALT